MSVLSLLMTLNLTSPIGRPACWELAERLGDQW